MSPMSASDAVGVRSSDGPPGLAREAVSGWLAAEGGLVRPLTFRRIGHGQSNLMYEVSDASGRRVVLRRAPLGPLPASAHDVAREHRVLRALQPTRVPTPRIVAYTEDRSISDVP